MGLFSAFKGQKKSIYFRSEDDAKSLLLVSVTALDGDVSDEELPLIISFGHMNFEDRDHELDVDRFVSLNASHSAQEIIAAAMEYLSPDCHKNMFFAACMLAMADGVVDEDEEAALLDMASLSPTISQDEASKLIEVATMLSQERALM